MGLAVFLRVAPMAQVSTRLLLSRRCISLWSAHSVQPRIKTHREMVYATWGWKYCLAATAHSQQD